MRPVVLASVAAAAAALGLACANAAEAAELDVRLRFAWGSSAESPQQWVGSITGASASLTDLQPLGIEADEAAALQLIDNQVLVTPLTPRTFDGCDVSIRGDEASVVTIRLQKSAAAEATEVRMPLGRLATEPMRTPMDDLGSYLLISRAPGDSLRVRIDRDHLVFAPGDAVRLTIAPNLIGQTAAAGDELEAKLTRVGSGAVVWESTQAIDVAAARPMVLELPAPAAEDAYRLTLAVRRPASGFSRLRQRPAPLATRDVEFVVIDPNARLPRLADAWDLVQTIDPIQNKWWRQPLALPQLDRLPVLTSPRTLSNHKSVIRGEGPSSHVELPAMGAGAEPAWRAFPLEIPEVGKQYVVEIDLPPGAPQQLAASVVEPDAAGRVMTFGREAGVFVDPAPLQQTAASQNASVHRIAFWPRTATPLLLLANQSPTLPAQFGSIRVLRRQVAEPAAEHVAASGRRTAAYISEPRFARFMGAAEHLDVASGLSVQGWSTFLEGGRRLAQELRAGGFNAAIVAVAADGSSLTGVADLGISPRYDSGLLSTSGSDAIRKDVLEALLRIFDREGLQLIPAIELAAPLPPLEALRRGGDSQATGVESIAADGRTWSEHRPGDHAGARYNLLCTDVQAAVGDIVTQMVARYGRHPSLAGVALQTPGHGFGVLPGLRWGMDDATSARFSADTVVTLATTGTNRFEDREHDLVGPNRLQWIEWRQSELTKFYGELASRIAVEGKDRQLLLCTEDLYAGDEAKAVLRQALNGVGRVTVRDATAEIGIDLEALAATPGVCVLRPRRVASDQDLEGRALDLLVNNAAELDHALAEHPSSGDLAFYLPQELRLPSFDAQSPFGADKTYFAADVPSYPVDVAAQRPLAIALAARDFETWVEGADQWPIVVDDQRVRLRRIFQELPGRGAEVRVEQRQPVTMRVFRAGDASTVFLVNELPWPVDVQVPLESSTPVAWQELGAAAGTSDAVGTLPSGANSWKLTLPPFGVAARRFALRSLRVGNIAVTHSDESRAELAARIQEIDEHMQALDVERAYDQLHNPGFELTGPDKLPLGWQSRIGRAGSVSVDSTVAASGTKSLHLESADRPGVAAQSQLFPIPSTGQLTVRARIRTSDLAEGSQVYTWAEYDIGHGAVLTYREFKLSAEAGNWNTGEVTFDDLPLGGGGQMRVHIQMFGAGNAWVDDVELFDLKFADSQKVQFQRRLVGARIHLDDGLLIDCQRLIDSYWPRYLVQTLPKGTPSTIGPDLGVAPPEVRVATQPDAPPASNEAQPGLSDRMKQLVPWRR
jgi:hypothetical protein